MRVFLLEDDSERIEWFYNTFSDAEIHLAKNVDDGKELLQNNCYDILFLDHDLEARHYASDCANDLNTGYGVACFLEENQGCQPDAIVIIHSLNPGGSVRMKQALRDRNVFQIPYYWKDNYIQFVQHLREND